MNAPSLLRLGRLSRQAVRRVMWPHLSCTRHVCQSTAAAAPFRKKHKKKPQAGGSDSVDRLIAKFGALAQESQQPQQERRGRPQRHSHGHTTGPRQRAKVYKHTCSGCGVEMQTRIPESAGFVPVEVVQQRALDEAEAGEAAAAAAAGKAHKTDVICQRCYQAKHHSQLTPVEVPVETMSNYLKAIQRLDVLVVQVVDIFNFHGSYVIPDLTKLLGGRNIVVYINKADLLPASAHLQRLQRWARTHLAAQGVRPQALRLVSAKKGFGMRDTLHQLKELAAGRDVVVIGAANVGKSTFINQLMHHQWNVDPVHKPSKRQRGIVMELDELPAGFQPGDVYTGDVAQLEAQLRLRRAARAGADSSDEEADGGADLDATQAVAAPHLTTPEAPPLTDLITLSSSSAVEASGAAVAVPPRPEDIVDGVPLSADPDAPHIPDVVRSTPLTTSPLPGTTLGVVSAPLTRTTRIHDTPGFVLHPREQALWERLGEDDGARGIESLIPKSRMKPVIYTLKPGRSIFLGGLGRIDYQHKNPNASLLFVWFGAVKPHLTRSTGADELFERHAGGILYPADGPLVEVARGSLPQLAEQAGVEPREVLGDLAAGDGGPDDYDRESRETRRARKVAVVRRQQRYRMSVLDIVFGGLGWFAVTPVEVVGSYQLAANIGGAAIRVCAAESLPVHLRPSLLPFEAVGTRPSHWKKH